MSNRLDFILPLRALCSAWLLVGACATEDPLSPDDEAPATDVGQTGTPGPAFPPTTVSPGNDSGALVESSYVTEGCVAESRPFDDSASAVLGFKAEDALGWLGRFRAATLTWSDGTSAALQLEIQGEPRVLFVDEKPDPNPEYQLGILPRCRAQLLIEASARLVSSDGRLSETVSPLRLYSYEAGHLLGLIQFKPRGVHGTYEASTNDRQCELLTNLRVHVSQAQFDGEVLSQIASSACDDIEDTTAVSERVEGTWRTTAP